MLEDICPLCDGTCASESGQIGTDFPLPASGVPFRLQFVSDLHAEFLAPGYKDLHVRRLLPEPQAPFIALLGDIGYPFESGYASVIAHCAANWEQVFVLLGNHEYYQGSKHRIMSDVELQVQCICEKYANVTCAIDHLRVDLDGVCMLFTTLWSDLGVACEERNVVVEGMNDYQKIWVSSDSGFSRPRRLRAADVQRRHLEARDWLEGQIAANDAAAVNTVVLTHHAPSMLFARGGPLAAAYASSLESLMKANVVAWLFGHVHENFEAWLGEAPTLCASNCRGYPEKSFAERTPVLAYEPGLFLEVGLAGVRLCGRRHNTFSKPSER